MKRKRFVKLLMADGWDRNSACWLARTLVQKRYTFSDGADLVRGGYIARAG